MFFSPRTVFTCNSKAMYQDMKVCGGLSGRGGVCKPILVFRLAQAECFLNRNVVYFHQKWNGSVLRMLVRQLL